MDECDFYTGVEAALLAFGCRHWIAIDVRWRLALDYGTERMLNKGIRKKKVLVLVR